MMVRDKRNRGRRMVWNMSKRIRRVQMEGSMKREDEVHGRLKLV